MGSKTWDEHDVKFLEENYKTMSDQELASCLVKTTKAVKDFRHTHGFLRDKQRGRRWSEQEIKVLTECWGNVPLTNIARKLGRTPAGVRQKAANLGLYDQLGQGEMLSIEATKRLLGIRSSKTIKLWIDKHGLKAKKQSVGVRNKVVNGRRVPKEAAQMHYIIHWYDLVDWLEAHQDLWDSRWVPRYALGCEYEWLLAKRERDKGKPARYKAWTTNELRQLEDYMDHGLSYKELAKRLGRSESSLRNQMAKIQKQRNIKQETA